MSPEAGFPLTAAADLLARLRAAFAGLREGRQLAEVDAAARRLLAEDPGFHPASVLLAQVSFLRRDDRGAEELLAPVADELPEYLACQLLLGRARERLGDIAGAFDALRAIAGAHEAAARRAASLAPRAVEIVYHRLVEDVDRHRLEDAEAHWQRLSEWAPDDRMTLDGARRLAVGKGDLEGELAVVTRLAAETGERSYRERRAELEVEIGDVRAGLALFEQLAGEAPDDPLLAEKLEKAKFLWRLQLLPAQVQRVGRKGQLDRSDVATLLYWLVPQVRYSQLSDPPIATDILDHPRRDEIVRVMNLRLVEVDETLHRFEPSSVATRQLTMGALLKLLHGSERRFSCLMDGDTMRLSMSRGWICRKAAQCRLIAEEAECLPAAPVSGAEALELFRRSLDLLGAS